MMMVGTDDPTVPNNLITVSFRFVALSLFTPVAACSDAVTDEVKQT